jgi:O-antigen ligase
MQNASHRLTAARVFAVTALCMVPVSTAFTNIACALFALALLSAPEFWRNLPSLLRHGAAASALLLLAALMASVAYTVAPHQEAWSWIGKYAKLLLLPLAVVAFKDSKWDGIVRWSWFVTLCVILLLSTTNYLGLTAIGPAHASALPLSRAWVFKNHIAAGLFGALLFHQAVDLALTTRNVRARVLFAAIAALALVNVFVMLQGRTGQIIALIFMLYTALRFAWRKHEESPMRAALYVCAVIAAAGMLVGVACTMKGGRLLEVATEVKEYRQTDAITSTGLRLEWYRKCFELIRARPVIGYGAGGLGVEFAKLSAGKTEAEGQLTQNPHNEYLLMAVQLGAIGVALFLNLLVQIGRGAAALDARSKQLLLGWLAAFAISCLANSLLLDFAEGHLLVLLAGILLGCGYRAPSPVKAVQGEAAPAPRQA